MSYQKIVSCLTQPLFTTVTEIKPIDENECVVTLGIDFADGKQPGRVIHELYRGTHSECLALIHQVAPPSHDGRAIDHWWLQSGLASAWEEFVRS